MVSEARKQLMAWMKTDYSKHTYFRWKVKWWLEHLGALGTVCETAPSIFTGSESLHSCHFWITVGSFTMYGIFLINSCYEFFPFLQKWCKGERRFSEENGAQTGRKRKRAWEYEICFFPYYYSVFFFRFSLITYGCKRNINTDTENGSVCVCVCV